jgi:hypothetical protein
MEGVSTRISCFPPPPLSLPAPRISRVSRSPDSGARRSRSRTFTPMGAPRRGRTADLAVYEQFEQQVRTAASPVLL